MRAAWLDAPKVRLASDALLAGSLLAASWKVDPLDTAPVKQSTFVNFLRRGLHVCLRLDDRWSILNCGFLYRCTGVLPLQGKFLQCSSLHKYNL